jgi:hypothetical protein
MANQLDQEEEFYRKAQRTINKISLDWQNLLI